MLLIYQEKNVLVDFARKSLFLVDKPSNSPSDPKDYCSYIHTVEYLREMYAEGADPLHVTVINDLHIDTLMTPAFETLRDRRRKNRIESKSIVVSKVRKTRSVICPLCNTQGYTRHLV